MISIKTFTAAAAAYFAIISIVTAAVTITDKIKAHNNRRRISEKSLIILAILGGSAAEYITMKLIRHKTLHKKFMIGLPAIIITQLAAVSVIIYFLIFKRIN